MRQVLFTPLSALPDDGVEYNTSFTFRVCVTKANEDGSRVCDAYGETQARSLYTLVPSLYAIPSARRASILEDLLSRRSFLSAHRPSLSILPTHLDASQLRF